MHDLPGSHDHNDHQFDVEEEHPLWKLDTITLTSVGIDIGISARRHPRLFSRAWCCAGLDASCRAAS
ncbi:MAG: hypothetical protein HYU46_02420 [Deltaproteobacteria bacterium]|nr:hypothetical protein [Deltaproteobacteria bacterium]